MDERSIFCDWKGTQFDNVLEEGSSDHGEHHHDDLLLREPLFENSTNDNGPDGPAAGAMHQDTLREQNSSIRSNRRRSSSTRVV